MAFLAIAWRFIVAYKKFFIYGAIALVLFVIWQRDRTAQWQKGIEEGDKRTQARMEEEFKKQWEAAQATIDAEKQKYVDGIKTNDEQRKLLNAKEEEIIRARRTIDAAAARIEATAKASVDAGYTLGQNLTDLNALDTIRALSRELEASRPKTPASTPNPR